MWCVKRKGEVTMDQQKKNHPSLPSNYVTLAQLQERWLKQQNQLNKPQQQEEEQQQHQHVAVVAPTNVTDSVSRSHPAKRYRPKNRRGNSRSNRRAAELASEDRRKSEIVAGIGDGNADADGKVGESKDKRKVKRKPKVKKRGARGEGTAAAQGNEGAEKTTIQRELNDKKEGDSVKVEEGIEQKFGDLSMNSGNGKGKQNGGIRRMKDGFRGSHSQGNSRGGRGYDYGDSRGKQQRFEVWMQKSEKMVWVRKDGGVG